MWNKLVRVKPTVLRLLKEEPGTRDSDELLILKVWAIQNPELRKKDFPFRTFAEAWLDGRLANAESIRRSRAKIQEDTESLRGKSYKPRQDEDDVVRSNIHDL